MRSKRAQANRNVSVQANCDSKMRQALLPCTDKSKRGCLKSRLLFRQPQRYSHDTDNQWKILIIPPKTIPTIQKSASLNVVLTKPRFPSSGMSMIGRNVINRP